SGGGVSNLKPVADAGADQTLKDTDNSGSETVILNGGASSDSDGTIVGYTWNEGIARLGSGAKLSTPLTAGAHNITLTVTDNDADTGSDSMVVIVNAGTPPNQLPIANAGSDEVLTDTDNKGGSSKVTVNYAVVLKTLLRVGGIECLTRKGALDSGLFRKRS
ncbi:MAG: PKD domain-containing protein, partial [Methylococcales bacterium]